MLTRLDDWEEREVLITVKAYPEPSDKYAETVCVAGTDLLTMKPIRIYPVRFRELPKGDQFRKFEVIRVSLKKNSTDARPESHYLDDGKSIQQIRRYANWKDRNPFVESWRAQSIEALVEQQKYLGQHTAASLALIRPKSVERFLIKKGEPDWSDHDKDKLTRPRMFGSPPKNMLNKIPYRFQYEFICDDDRCNGHRFTVFDWEAGVAFLKFRRDYGDDWEPKCASDFGTKCVRRRTFSSLLER